MYLWKNIIIIVDLCGLWEVHRADWKKEYMFDIDAVKCYYNNKEGATDRRLAWNIVSYKNNRSEFAGLGRLFLCLIIALRSNGITKSKASNTQADDGYKKIRRKHTQALH